MIKKLQHRIEIILSLTIIGIVVVLLVFAMMVQYNENTSTLEKTLRRAEDLAYDSYYDSIFSARIQQAGDDESGMGPAVKTADAFPDVKSYAVFIEDQSLSSGEELISSEASGDAGDISVENKDSGIAYVQNGDADRKDVAALAKQMRETGNDSGLYSHYLYDIRYVEDMTQITFIDTRSVRGRLIQVFAISGIIGGAAVIGAIIISIVLARYLVQPIAENIKKQKQFVADASHELKTPLAVVDVNIDMALSSPGNDKYLGYIKGETKKMNRLIQELLMLASVEDGEDMEQGWERFNLSETIEGVILPFEAAAFEKGVVIDQHMEEGITFYGEPLDISRMAEILIENAINHSDPDSSIDVKLSQAKGHIYFSVGNHGATIDQESQKHLFERFYRVDKARNRKEGHFGLGLAIAKATTDRYDGTISVSSEDGYTVFTVVLKK